MKEVRLATKKTGQSRGFAYVEFASESDAHKALSLNKHVLDGQELSVALSAPPGKRSADVATQPRVSQQQPTGYAFDVRQ